LEKFVTLQKYTSQAEKERQAYLKALTAYEAEKKSGVSKCVFINIIFW